MLEYRHQQIADIDFVKN